MKQLFNFPIERVTSFKQSGTLDNLYLVDSLEELQSLLPKLKSFHILGKGSNTLFNTSIQQLPVVKLSPSFGQAKKISQTVVQFPASYSIQACNSFLKRHQLGGLEFAIGVPASIGGMCAMNFSCWEQEVSSHILRVQVAFPNGTTSWLSHKECAFSYRSSRMLKEHLFILNVEIQAVTRCTETHAQHIRHFLKQRHQHHPMKQCSFGSLFKNNAQKLTSGKLIESLGFKNKQAGAIKVSNQHANFLINTKPGMGNFDDTLSLIEQIKTAAKQYYKTELELEVIIL